MAGLNATQGLDGHVLRLDHRRLWVPDRHSIQLKEGFPQRGKFARRVYVFFAAVAGVFCCGNCRPLKNPSLSSETTFFAFVKRSLVA